MLKVTYRLKLGQDEFEINAEVKDEKEFFETMSFYSNLPKTAPGGAADLKLVFRTTTEGHKYYSLVSEKEKMEFKFGQNLDKNGGGLFPKGWDKLYEKGADGDNTKAAPGFGTETKSTQPAPSNQAFGSQQMPQPMNVQGPAQTAPAQAAPPQVSPQVAAVATNVLARFGIPKQT